MPKKLWEPSKALIKNSNLFNYEKFLSNNYKYRFSGNYKKLLNWSLKNQKEFKSWALSDDEKQEDQVLPIIAKRLPEVPGTHEITYKSDIDRISLTHEAKNRKGFALGAVIAAEWLIDKKGTFTMSDIINFKSL